jgi:two-component system NarL family sensor kinase
VISPRTLPEAETVADDAGARLLLRLGFDLHDGPLQQVYALVQDVRLLREQVDALLDGMHGRQMKGRFDDVEAQLAELHRDLRDLAESLEPTSLLQQPLVETVSRELGALERRSKVTTSLELHGALDHLTPSQTITLLRVLQESLSNIRHSGARSVSVTLRGDADRIRLDVHDDGRGFELSYGDGGRGMGLVAMRERLRLVGGRLEIRSSGAGTRVTAALPRWRPAPAAVHPEG